MSHTKICIVCNQEKPIEQFDIGFGGRTKSHCWECNSAVGAWKRERKRQRDREWAKKNPEKVKATARAMHEKNREERLRYMRHWRQSHKEHIQEYQREYTVGKRRKGQNEQ